MNPNGSSRRGISRQGGRSGDAECVMLSRSCRQGDRVAFDPGPGLRVTGILRDWKDDWVAVVEVDRDDVGVPQQKPKYAPKGAVVHQLSEVKPIMHVPVTR